MKCGVQPETADMAWVHCKETAADGLAWETDELVSWPYTRAASTFVYHDEIINLIKQAA